MTLLATLGAIFTYACCGALVAGYYTHLTKIAIRAGTVRDDKVDGFTVMLSFVAWPIVALFWGAIYMIEVATATFDNRGTKK